MKTSARSDGITGDIRAGVVHDRGARGGADGVHVFATAPNHRLGVGA